MKAFFKNTKFTNQHGILVGFFAEGDSQKEADDKFAESFLEAFEHLQTITKGTICPSQKP